MTQGTNRVLSAEIQQRSKTDRCALVRFSCSQEVYCQPVAASTAKESETRWLGRFREISADGLALVLRRRFEPGTSLTIELAGKTKQERRSFPVQVVQCTPEGQSRWIIECELLSPLTEEQLQALLQQ
jgi:hypothetical protein